MPGSNLHPRRSGDKRGTNAELPANRAQRIEQKISLEVFRLPDHDERWLAKWG